MAIIGRITSQTTPMTPKVHAVAGMQDTSAQNDVGFEGGNNLISDTKTEEGLDIYEMILFFEGLKRGERHLFFSFQSKQIKST